MTSYRRRAVNETNNDEKRNALANAGVRVGQNVSSLVTLPEWKTPAMFARLQKVIGSVVRIVDTTSAYQRDSQAHKNERNTNPVFVREGVLTDLAWGGSSLSSSLQVDGRWYDFAVSDLLDDSAEVHRHIYITVDLLDMETWNQGSGADGDNELAQQALSHSCSYGDCKRRGSDRRRQEQKEFIAELRRKRPRTLAFASWK